MTMLLFPSLRASRHYETAKQSRDLICTWIASQARNDDATVPVILN